MEVFTQESFELLNRQVAVGVTMPAYHTQVPFGLQIVAKMLLLGGAHVAHVYAICWIRLIFLIA